MTKYMLYKPEQYYKLTDNISYYCQNGETYHLHKGDIVFYHEGTDYMCISLVKYPLWKLTNVDISYGIYDSMRVPWNGKLKKLRFGSFEAEIICYCQYVKHNLKTLWKKIISSLQHQA